MARNRGIKIFNEFLLDNPRTYNFIRGSSQKRPMTVSYQVPLEPDSDGRPVTAHVKLEKPGDSITLCQPPPPPLIRDLAEAAKSKPKPLQFFNSEFPKNTGSSLLQESKPLKFKVNRKFSDTTIIYRTEDRKSPGCSGEKVPEKSYGDRKRDDKEAKENLPKEKTGPQTQKKDTKNSVDSKGRGPCKVCAPDFSSLRKTNESFRVKSPWKKEKVSSNYRIAVENRINQILDHKTTNHSKLALDLTRLSQVDTDGSAFLIQQLKNIKSNLIKGDKKVSMKDAVLVINDLKSKISSLYKTCTNEDLAKVVMVKSHTKMKRIRKPVVDVKEEKKVKRGIKILEQAQVKGPVLTKPSQKDPTPVVKNINSPMYSTSNNFCTKPLRNKTMTSIRGTKNEGQNIEPSATKKLSTKGNLKPKKF